MFLSGLALLALGAAHPESESRSQVVVDGARATVTLRFQSLSFLEVFPAFDVRLDGAFDAEELAGARAALGEYLLQRFHILRADVPDGDGEQALQGKVLALEIEQGGSAAALGMQTLRAELEFQAPVALDTLTVESQLFHETNPWHRDFCSIEWNGAEAAGPHIFQGSETRWLFEPAHVRRAGVLLSFLKLGLEHILGRPDHLAFLLALLVVVRRARALLGVVTAFTLANALTLTLAAHGTFALPARFVELALALSVAYVACDNLLRGTLRNPWLEALLFGLLHGSAYFLADALAGEPLITSAFVGFHAGVELGQLAFAGACVLVFALVFRAWRRAQPRAGEGTGLVPPRMRVLCSIAVALLGFYWFVQRTGWLSPT